MAGLLDSAGGAPFDIMGLLLGGRGYAANWFANRDQQRFDQQQQQARGQFATGLLNTPEFKAAVTNPEEAARYALWAKGQGGPTAIADAGNQFMSQALGALYGRQNAAFSSELQRQEIRLSADEQLRVDQIRRDRDKAAVQAQMDALGPQAKQNLFYRQAFGDLPEGMDAVALPNGDFAFRPAFGTKEYNSVVAQGNAYSNIQNSAEQLLNMMEQGNMDANARSQWRAVAGFVLGDTKAAFETGALDQGVVDWVGKIFPAEPPNASQVDLWGQRKEQLRRAILEMQNRQQQLQNRSLIPRSEFSRSKIYDPANLPPPPVVSPRQAQEGNQKRLEDLRPKRKPEPLPSAEEAERPAYAPRSGWGGRRLER